GARVAHAEHALIAVEINEGGAFPHLAGQRREERLRLAPAGDPLLRQERIEQGHRRQGCQSEPALPKRNPLRSGCPQWSKSSRLAHAWHAASLARCGNISTSWNAR